MENKFTLKKWWNRLKDIRFKFTFEFATNIIIVSTDATSFEILPTGICFTVYIACYCVLKQSMISYRF
jgi:hypothetical protein